MRNRLKNAGAALLCSMFVVYSALALVREPIWDTQLWTLQVMGILAGALAASFALFNYTEAARNKTQLILVCALGIPVVLPLGGWFVFATYDWFPALWAGVMTILLVRTYLQLVLSNEA
jgi:hypothetical protein